MSKLPSLLALAAITALLAGCASAPDDDPAAATAAAADGFDISEHPEAVSHPDSHRVERPHSGARRARDGRGSDRPCDHASGRPGSISSSGTGNSRGAGGGLHHRGRSGTRGARRRCRHTAPRVACVDCNRHPGSSVAINGSGHEPGQKVFIGMGVAQTDSFVMDDQVAIADAAGAYSFTIAIEADLPPRTYARADVRRRLRQGRSRLRSDQTLLGHRRRRTVAEGGRPSSAHRRPDRTHRA